MSSVAEKLQRKSQRPVATKQVRLKLVYVDFWSTVKLSFLVAVSLGVVLVVATILIYLVLQSTGVFDKVDALLIDILTEDGFSIAKNLSLGTVGFFSIIVAIVNIIVGTALGAITSLLYNLSVRLTGGLLVGFTNN
ncbi:DUF3566 domain-containing protein [Glaciihabitans arcticus]|uniref:DUF3566 domain-containing protein n=1 Tax=Glaciihabitans arcticus TaxID=2668039 RepID=A0A4Q9H0D0_9MICO|nr:DUF3566 domain-containing protein [Glaciihabitans arcticus]TBN58150.1 DUF3566 domain-containing protein [Glaciihabitans arcticus]